MIQTSPLSNSAIEQIKDGNESFAEVSGNLKFPLLEDPNNVFPLMRGESNSVQLLNFAIAFSAGASWTRTIPIPGIPVLNAEIAAKLGFEFKVGAGFDTLGVAQLSEKLDYSSRETLVASLHDPESRLLLQDGFFFDDNNSLGAEDHTSPTRSKAMTFAVLPGGFCSALSDRLAKPPRTRLSAIEFTATFAPVLRFAAPHTQTMSSGRTMPRATDLRTYCRAARSIYSRKTKRSTTPGARTRELRTSNPR